MAFRTPELYAETQDPPGFEIKTWLVDHPGDLLTPIRIIVDQIQVADTTAAKQANIDFYGHLGAIIDDHRCCLETDNHLDQILLQNGQDFCGRMLSWWRSEMARAGFGDVSLSASQPLNPLPTPERAYEADLLQIGLTPTDKNQFGYDQNQIICRQEQYQGLIYRLQDLSQTLKSEPDSHQLQMFQQQLGLFSQLWRQQVGAYSVYRLLNRN